MGPFVCCAGNNVCLQDDKLTILATLFWVGTSLLESDYEHEFLLGVRLLARVMARLPLDRPDVRERLDRTQAHTAPSLHSLLLKAIIQSNTTHSLRIQLLLLTCFDKTLFHYSILFLIFANAIQKISLRRCGV